MRPLVLNPLFAALSALPGIGPKLEKLFSHLLARDGEHGTRHRSAVSPAGRLRRPAQPAKISEVVPDTIVTVAVTVDRHRPPPSNRPRAPYNIDTSDATNTLMITYFNARRDYLEKLYPKARCATSRAPRRSMTAICKCCIPTAWSTRRDLPACR